MLNTWRSSVSAAVEHKCRRTILSERETTSLTVSVGEKLASRRQQRSREPLTFCELMTPVNAPACLRSERGTPKDGEKSVNIHAATPPALMGCSKINRSLMVGDLLIAFSLFGR